MVAALSLAVDLGLGQPWSTCSAQAWSVFGADTLGLDPAQRRVVYYSSLLAWIGCHADSSQLAAWFGDDIAFRADSYGVGWTGLPFRGHRADDVTVV